MAKAPGWGSGDRRFKSSQPDHTMPNSLAQIKSQLNEQQLQAVESIEGPVMVLAGPGTGKTQVLAARIANILEKTDTNPSSVLALTFTESAARNMRERLVSMIGRTGYYVRIHTFHSFAKETIEQFPEFFDLNVSSQALSELERYQFFESIIHELDLKVLKPINQPFFYLHAITKAISDLKREHISPERLQQLIEEDESWLQDNSEEITKGEREKRQRSIAKQQELVQVYQGYQQLLQDKHRYDFEDMINVVVNGFEDHPELLLELQEQLLYFLVDEYQDTNAAQNALVLQLASFWDEAANLFVVGDPHQAIYRFQGASVENVLGFLNHYPRAKVINLQTGYRASQNLYDAAHALIQHNNLTTKLPNLTSFNQQLQSVKGRGSLIEIKHAPSQIVEVIDIAQEITRLIESGTPAEEIAVLYRHNKDSELLMEVFDRWQIPYEVEGTSSLFDQPLIQHITNMLRVIYTIVHGSEDGVLYQVMRQPWFNLDSVLMMQLSRVAGKNHQTLIEVIEQGYVAFAEKSLATPRIEEAEFEEASKWLERVRTWSYSEATQTFPEWLERLYQASGLVEWVRQQPHRLELLHQLRSFFNFVQGLCSSMPTLNLTSFLNQLDTMQRYGITVEVEDLNITKDAVKLATVHKAKGLEWQYVFIPQVIDGKWSNSRQRELLPLPSGVLSYTDISEKERNEDDRRLFYVALTRAKQQVTISIPSSMVSEQRIKEVSPSMFVTELAETGLTESQEVTVSAEDQEQLLDQLVNPIPMSSNPEREREFFQEVVKEFKLSVTALNTYLKDPEQFVDENLLKVPQAQSEPQAYGSAVHLTLEKLLQQYKDHKTWPDETWLKEEFKTALGRQLLHAESFERRLAEGNEVLINYLNELKNQTVQPVYLERYFGGGWGQILLDDIPLVGKIDRIDWIDPTKQTVRVIDYKTAKAVSNNSINGQVASQELSDREKQLPDTIRGPLKRQLVFYALLASLDPSFKPTVTEAVFEFIQGKNNQLVSRKFEITEQEVSDLKTVIKEVMAEIQSLAWLDDEVTSSLEANATK